MSDTQTVLCSSSIIIHCLQRTDSIILFKALKLKKKKINCILITQSSATPVNTDMKI